VPPVGLGLAVVAAAALAYTVWHVARRQLKTAPDAEIAARLDRLAEDRPEPPAVPLPVPHLRWAPAGRAGDRRRRLTVATVVALLIPAGKRLGAHWPRLLGLFAGLLLAAAVAATVPLYVAGSLTRVLHAGLTPVNSRPAGATLLAYYPPAGAPFSQADLQRLGAVAAAAGSAVGLPATPVTTYTATGNGNVSTLATPGLRAPIQPYVGTMTIDALSGLAAHVQVTSGRMYTDAPRPDGAIEVVADESAVQAMHLELGRLYRFAPAGAGPALTVQLVGVTRQVEPTGPYWPYRYYHSDFLTAPRVLAQLLGAGEVGFGEAAWYCTLDMRQLNAESVPAVLGSLQRFGLHVAGTVAGAKLDVSPYKVLADFVTRAQTLQALLRLVSIPVIALALYFVAITASLIVAAEEAEIAVYVSRGAGAAHILALYIFEWCMLAVPVAAIAPFPAALFAAAMGAASGFLHFVPRPPLPVLLTRADFVYAAATALVGVGTALVPVVAALGRSIVAQRLRTSRTVEQPLWQRAYLDLAALAVLGVLWLLFRGAALQPGAGAAAIAADPALYLLPAAFLAVSGLLVVRLVGWCLRTLDLAVGPWASPGLVLPLRRIGRLPAQFAPVLLLLCFTAALGSYSAAAARTLDANLTAAVQYRVGAPVRLQEVSPCITMTPEVGACVTYDNAPIGPTGTRPMPPFDLHQQIPGIAGATELLTETVAVSSAPGQPQATLVLVDPDTYANVGWWMNGLNPQTLDWYMQQLRDRPNAVFFSRSLTQTARIGDHGPVELTDQITAKTAAFQAVGGVDLWPGAGLSGPFAVANLHYALSAFGIAESSRIALLRLQPGARVADVVSALGDRAIFVGSQDQAAPEVTAALATTEWAGQSGMLSVGFLVALCVTILGYLFYAALLLRGQLSQLGLLRALGLPWRQLVGTVAAEQGTLLLSGAAAGTLAGLIAAALFLPLFRPAFSGPYSPPFIASGPGAALAEVALVMLGLLAVALGALLLLLRRMHVGETVKLED